LDLVDCDCPAEFTETESDCALAMVGSTLASFSSVTLYDLVSTMQERKRCTRAMSN
jgi:hypothetical protein